MKLSHMKEGILLLSGLTTLGACTASPTDANADNFKAVLNLHYAKNLECFGVGSSNDPTEYIYVVDVPNKSGLSSDTFRKNTAGLFALVDVGVMTVQDINVERKFFSQTKSVPAKEFKLSDLGKSYLKNASPDNRFGSYVFEMCYGRRNVEGVSNFTAPSEIRGATVSSVNYSYNVVDIADWAKSPELSAVFPFITKNLNGPQEDADDLVLSGKGWVHSSEFD